jgi:hypothetical protein
VRLAQLLPGAFGPHSLAGRPDARPTAAEQ